MFKRTVLVGLLTSVGALAHPLKLMEFSNRFETSEVRGLYTSDEEKLNGIEKLGYRLEILTAPITELTFTRSYRNQPPGLRTDDDVHFRVFRNYGVNLGVCILERLEFTLAVRGEDTPNLFGLKFQWLGKSSRQAVKGDFSLSTGVAYAGTSDKDTTAPIPTGSYEYEIESWSLDAIAGYRLRDSVLLYSGLNFLRSRIEGHIQQPIQEGFGVHYHYYFNGIFTQYMLTLGAMYEYELESRGNIFVKGEFSSARFDYYGFRSLPFNFGVSGGLQF